MEPAIHIQLQDLPTFRKHEEVAIDLYFLTIATNQDSQFVDQARELAEQITKIVEVLKQLESTFIETINTLPVNS